MTDLAEDALRHRLSTRNTVFIGITGSCGKTTTKDLSAGLLRPDFSGLDSSDDSNCGSKLVANILNVKPGDAFCIQELGAWGPGTLDAGLRLVRPDVGIVLNIRNDHYTKFKGLAHTQAEKSKVVRVLPDRGTAILNADDPNVWEMRHWTSATVLGFGVHRDAELRAERVSSVWPERLSFDLVYRGSVRPVRTQLLGEHLLGSALAALGVALVMSVPLDTAVERLAGIPPTPRRMSPLDLDPGVTFIRDDFKATADSQEEVVRFLSQARARRKVAVLGHVSDYPGRSRQAYSQFATALATAADLLVLVGERAEELWGRQRRGSPEFLGWLGPGGAKARLFETVREASEFIRHEVRPGDLVFLKGSGVSDHLERILLQFRTTVRCWETRCGRVIACDACEHLSPDAVAVEFGRPAAPGPAP